MTSRAVTHQVYPLERSLRPVVKMQVLQGARGANDTKEVWPAGWQQGAGAGVPRDSGSHIHIQLPERFGRPPTVAIHSNDARVLSFPSPSATT